MLLFVLRGVRSTRSFHQGQVPAHNSDYCQTSCISPSPVRIPTFSLQSMYLQPFFSIFTKLSQRREGDKYADSHVIHASSSAQQAPALHSHNPTSQPTSWACTTPSFLRSLLQRGLPAFVTFDEREGRTGNMVAAYGDNEAYTQPNQCIRPTATPVSQADSLHMIGENLTLADTPPSTVSEPGNISTNAFVHASLDLEANSIRLIQLRSDLSPSGHIQCDVRESTINDGYTCLSYEWGTGTPNKLILIGDATFPIRQNLWDFLEVARQWRQPPWLWIDALCIDQSNTKERNHQVQRMGKIYKNAQEVLSWLGNNKDIVRSLEPSGVRRPYGGTLQALVSSPYWDRAWVTQEICLGRKLTVVAGTNELPFNIVMDRARHWRNMYHPPLRFMIYNLADIRESMSYEGSSLIELLARCHYTQCTSWQDKAYSLLALCSEGNDVRVNYDLSRQELAMQVLRSCKQSFCLCSGAAVAEAFGLGAENSVYDQENPRNEADALVLSTPVAKLTLRVRRDTPIIIVLGDLCSNVDACQSPTLQVLLDPSDGAVQTSKVNMPIPSRYFRKGAWMRLSPDGLSCTIWFTLGILIEFGRTHLIITHQGYPCSSWRQTEYTDGLEWDFFEYAECKSNPEGFDMATECILRKTPYFRYS